MTRPTVRRPPRRPALPRAALACALALLPAAVAAQGAKPPEPAPLRPYELPKPQQFTLPNGVKVVAVERSTLPIVSARILLDAGSVYEPDIKSGLAVLTGSLLREGAGPLTGAQIAERMDALGAQFSTGAGYTQAQVSVTALNTVFADALALAASTLTQPTFPEAEFARRKAEALAADEQKKARVEGIEPDVFFRAIFEPSSPYARPAEGTKTSIAGLTRDDVVGWHRTMYSPANTTVLIVGAIAPAEARRVAERALGAWRAPAPKLPAVRNAPRPASGTRVILVDRPGSVQSAIRVGQASIAVGDPSYLPMVALNRVFGGGVNARLNNNLREKHGYTYGAFSALDARRDVGAFFATSTVRTDATDSALVEAVAEYKRLASEAIPAEEFRAGVNNVVASFPASVQTAQGLAGRMQFLLNAGLPLDYWGSYRERLAAVTPEAALRAAKERLTPNALTIVVVGDLSKIEAPVRARNLGAVEVWDADGNKVR